MGGGGVEQLKNKSFFYVEIMWCTVLHTLPNEIRETSILICQHDLEICFEICLYTVIRLVWVSAKLGTCTVVSVTGTLVEAKMFTLPLNLRILSSTSVPFTLTKVQEPNLALTYTKRITV